MHVDLCWTTNERTRRLDERCQITHAARSEAGSRLPTIVVHFSWKERRLVALECKMSSVACVLEAVNNDE